MFLATLFIKSKKKKKKTTKCILAAEQINKLCYIHTMKSYSAIERKELLIHTITRIYLKNITPSERNQSQKTYCMISYMSFFKKSKLQQQKADQR